MVENLPAMHSTLAPRVSVIVVTYMRAADIARCLDSLVAQTFTDFEVLVCDDGSTDGTGAVVERYKGVLNLSYHWAENFGGPSRPRNVGLRLARGIYVAFLDSDDWWDARKLERSVQELDRGSDVVYHDLRIVRTQRILWGLKRAFARPLSSPVFEDLLERGNALTNSSVVLRRKLLLDVGGVSEDPRLMFAEDYDCWLRLARVTEKFLCIEEPLGYYALGSGNASSPERTVRSLNRFHEIYLAPAGRCKDEDLPAWYHYSMGRAQYRLHASQQALRHLAHAVRGRLPLIVRMKALLTFLGALVRRCTNASAN
jgi:glycosyltransferase involved in cell wall biosynthesis